MIEEPRGKPRGIFDRKEFYLFLIRSLLRFRYLYKNEVLPKNEKFNVILADMIDHFESAFNTTGKSSETRYYAHILFAFLNGLLISFRKYPGRSDEEVVAHMNKLGTIFSSVFEQTTGEISS